MRGGVGAGGNKGGVREGGGGEGAQHDSATTSGRPSPTRGQWLWAGPPARAGRLHPPPQPPSPPPPGLQTSACLCCHPCGCLRSDTAVMCCAVWGTHKTSRWGMPLRYGVRVSHRDRHNGGGLSGARAEAARGGGWRHLPPLPLLPPPLPAFPSPPAARPCLQPLHRCHSALAVSRHRETSTRPHRRGALSSSRLQDPPGWGGGTA